MNESRMMQQVLAIFSIFMVFFYLGAGGYLVFYSNMSYLDKPVRVIIGSAFIIYGLYRAYRSYIKIVEVFFTKDNDKE
jgi:hypothetical protein